MTNEPTYHDGHVSKHTKSPQPNTGSDQHRRLGLETRARADRPQQGYQSANHGNP